MKLKELIFKILKNSGLRKNDIVLFHSNIKPLYKYLLKQRLNFKLKDICSCMIEYFDNKGTLIIPAFNFDFCRGKPYYAKETQSKMGVLSEEFRKISILNRTWHPVYSFSLHGNFPKEILLKKKYKAFGDDPVFNFLNENNGKIAILDLPDQNSMTFYHYIEEKLNVNWRYHKEFCADYYNFDNQIIREEKTLIFVRKKEKDFEILTDVNQMQKILFNKRLYTSQKNSIDGLRSIEAKVVYEEVEKVIKNNLAEGILYKKV